MIHAYAHSALEPPAHAGTPLEEAEENHEVLWVDFKECAGMSRGCNVEIRLVSQYRRWAALGLLS
jgi:hypothetical protein